MQRRGLLEPGLATRVAVTLPDACPQQSVHDFATMLASELAQDRTGRDLRLAA